MTSLIIRRNYTTDQLNKAYNKIEHLFSEISSKNIPSELEHYFLHQSLTINNYQGEEKELIDLIDDVYDDILHQLRTKLKIIPKNYYHDNGITNGIAFYGLPLGILLYVLTKQTEFIAIGFSIGMIIGAVVGILKDKKAKIESRQLNIEES